MTDKTYTEETVRLAETRTDVRIITWTGLVNGQAGVPIEWPFGADKSIQVDGTPGAAGHILLQGSNDRVNFYTLTDPEGNNIDFTATGLKAITELALQVRPFVSAGDGTSLWTATLLMRRARTY